MKHILLAAAAILALNVSPAYADEPSPAPVPSPAPSPPPTVDPNQPPRTHIDTTVVGDSVSKNSDAPVQPPNLDSDHEFRVGAPHPVRATSQLNLSAQQKAQLNDAIERADAGAAILVVNLLTPAQRARFQALQPQR